jgi:hypothetical protein
MSELGWAEHFLKRPNRFWEVYESHHNAKREFGLSTRTRSQPAREVPYYVKALAMAIPAIMLGFQISGWIFFAAPIRDGHPDFRANYTAGYMARTGQIQQLYDYEAIKRVQDTRISVEAVGMPFIHPAYEALLFIPFSFLGFHGAYFAFLCTNLLLLAFCFRLLHRWLESLSPVWDLLPAAVLFTFLPVAAALMQEPDSIVLLALLTLATTMLDDEKEALAGILVGLGLYRLQLVIPIAVLFLLWRRWRFICGFALSSALVLTISVWLTGVSQTRLYLRSLASMSVGGTSQLEQLRYYQPITHMGNLRALVFGLTSGWLSPLGVQVLTVGLSIMALLALLSFAPYAKGSKAMLVATTASVLVSYHLFIHDMSILVLPVAIALSQYVRRWESGSPNRSLAFSSAVMFSAPALMVFAPFHFYLVCFPLLWFLFVLVRSASTAELQRFPA